jgi:hypothetical protein
MIFDDIDIKTAKTKLYEPIKGFKPVADVKHSPMTRLERSKTVSYQIKMRDIIDEKQEQIEEE